MALSVAVPHERRPDERRVALVPQFVGPAARPRRVGAGRVRLRARRGLPRRGLVGRRDPCPDFDATVAGADVVLKVAPPTLDEAARLPAGCLLVCMMSPTRHLDVVEALRARGVGVLAMDLVPRLTRARSMNAVTSQATVAGYKAALLAAEFSPRLFPMLTTAAGTVRPANVVVVGAGVAGLQAIATVRRLGARVEAYDIRRIARERIESLGARAIETGVVAEASDGTARTLRASESARQREVLAERLSKAHAVICAASIPHREAPKIIDAAMVEGMLPGHRHRGHRLRERRQLRAHPPGRAVLARRRVHQRAAEPAEPRRRALERDVRQERREPARARARRRAHPARPRRRDRRPHRAAPRGPGPSPADRRAAGTAGDRLRRVRPRRGGAAGRGARAGVEPEEEDASAGWAVAEGDVLDAVPPAVTDESPDAAGDGRAGRCAGAARDAAGDSVPDEPAPADDFTAIDGVGPALATRLRGFGYRRFDEIAALDDAGLERLAVQLELDDEAVAGDWRGQAGRLAASGRRA